LPVKPRFVKVQEFDEAMEYKSIRHYIFTRICGLKLRLCYRVGLSQKASKSCGREIEASLSSRRPFNKLRYILRHNSKEKLWSRSCKDSDICTFDLEIYSKDKIIVNIGGGKELNGKYCLLHFKPKEKNWLFFKLDDNSG
jgi:hypothetical protein